MYPYEEGNTDRHADRKIPVHRKAQTGVMLLVVKAQQRWPTDHQRIGERRGINPNSPQKDPSLISDSQHQSYETISFAN